MRGVEELVNRAGAGGASAARFGSGRRSRRRERRFDGGERGLGLRAVGAAGLRHVGAAAAALAAERLGRRRARGRRR